MDDKKVTDNINELARQARRTAGLDPEEARVRDEKTVEGYIG